MNRVLAKSHLVVGLVILLSASTVATSGEQAEFTVTDFRATFASHSPTILERPHHLDIRTPHFAANATVRCSTPVTEQWTIGFIQQVTRCDFVNSYDLGATSWEFPHLPLSDARSDTLPWYGNEDERAVLAPGLTSHNQELAMDDELAMRTTWAEPMPPEGRTFRSHSRLRTIRRRQDFLLWLVARRSPDGHTVVLRKVSWFVEVSVDVDPTKPIGSRATLLPHPIAPPTVTHGTSEDTAAVCTVGPVANDAQEFWWTPRAPKDGGRTRLRKGN